MEPWLSLTNSTKPHTPIATNSGGPNLRAALPRNEVASISPRMLMVPATKDPTADTDKAAPPRPFRAI